MISLTGTMELSELTDFKLSERHIVNVEEPQVRLNFRYNGQYYNLQITDHDFLEEYGRNKCIFHLVNKISVTFEPTVTTNGMPIKRVTKIAVLEKEEYYTSEDDFDELPF